MAFAGIQRFEGFVAQGAHSLHTRLPCSAPSVPRPSARTPFSVVAQKKVKKTQQVILTKDVQGVGSKGELARVVNGYWRNYLQPQGYAVPATEAVLAQIQRRIDGEERLKQEEKAKAQAMATALATIGKFVIRKKVGEKDQIFGSVTTAEVAEAIELQTGRTLDKGNITLPEIKTLGTYDATVKLHPEVTGSFKIVLQKLKNA